MKKFKIESPHGTHKKRFRSIQDAIAFKKTLCPFQNWVVKIIR